MNRGLFDVKSLNSTELISGFFSQGGHFVRVQKATEKTITEIFHVLKKKKNSKLNWKEYYI